jgi:hypothetical protein
MRPALSAPLAVVLSFLLASPLRAQQQEESPLQHRHHPPQEVLRDLHAESAD